ncbi:MAG: ATP-binding protein [Catalinimonas sp.]
MIPRQPSPPLPDQASALLFERTTEPCLLVKDEQLVATNPAARAWLGYAPGAGQSWTELLLDRVSLPGEGRLVARLRHNEGYPLSAEIYVDPLTDDGLKLIRIRSVEAPPVPGRSARYYQALAEYAYDVVTVRDAEGRFEYVSPAARHVLGYDPEALIGRSFEMIPEAKRKEAQAEWQRLLKHPGQVFHFQVQMQHLNGNPRVVEGTAVNLLHDPDVRGVVSNLRDVSERYEAEQLLEAYNERLKEEVQQQTQRLKRKNDALEMALDDLGQTQIRLLEADKMASLGELTAGIAHEINNPINFVSSNVTPLQADLDDLRALFERYDALRTADDLPAALAEVEKHRAQADPDFLFKEIDALLNGIREGAGRTRDIVVGLRNFSRVDEDDFKLAQIHDGLESTLMLLRNRLKGNIEVHRDYADLPAVECLPGKLNQVFMNVIGNAAQAVGERGNIWITTELLPDGKRVRVKIRDDGPGMTEEVRKRVFEPFYTTKGVGKGTGLGLSISFTVIEKHHGTLDVESAPGRGATFIITLPVRQPEAKE